MITDLKQLWREAFSDPEAFIDGFFGAGFSPDRFRCLYAHGQLAAALYWFDVSAGGRKYAYLYAVATSQNLRSKGYCRRLLHQTHQQLKRCGYSGAILVPGAESLFAFYKKLGYIPFGSIREFTCQAGESVPLQKLTATQYALARRKLLPKGGVLQEGAALAFLNTYTGFWQGDGWLLAGSVENQTLHVQEFLGDEALAPSVTAALGASEGVFRTPGKGRAFAMYYPLDDTPAPDYFGLAMD